MSQSQRHSLPPADTKRSQHQHNSTARDISFKSGYESCQLVYDMRRDVLDKLDLILQKVNIKILKALDTGSKSIKLVSMTDLQQEIEELFRKLDECIFSRESEFQVYDNDLLVEIEKLKEESRVLRRQNLELRHWVEETRGGKDSPIDKISALQRQVQMLNNQINRYGDFLKQSPSLQQQKYLSHNKLLLNLHNILKQSGRLRLLALGTKKVFKQYSHWFSSFKSDTMMKINEIVGRSQQRIHHLEYENGILREQLKAWEYDIENVVLPKITL